MIKETQLIMGMPITLIFPDEETAKSLPAKVFEFFNCVDRRYSPFIDDSDVSKIKRKELDERHYSAELKEILKYAEQTKKDSDGYFDVWHDGTFDPSGIVKGWAIQAASDIARQHPNDFYIDAGGDIQVGGVNAEGKPWRVGIRNPFNRHENIAIVELHDQAIATSGTAIRGQHIYNPRSSQPITDIVSLTVIAKDIVDADRMATAAFAMGRKGIKFIEQLSGYEGFMVDHDRKATMTSGWHKYEAKS